ncbi:poly [ADP-ribose] polymerase 12-like [Paramuricea clavata]|uniref:Poly [ADP-ribose] polymerase 12-like n=1 Tax=Paramuricea clavata TaxID=317549 RepID=A0A7D9IZS2_PARCT|nr:poly [ADP-ribose] polymerase 12-like [Paramuricea clavata]
MDEGVLKKVCKFLKKQKDNEAVFQTFWEGTKEFYPVDLSKTKVKAWLKEHPERFEIIKGETGNPFGKIKLKVEASNYVLPTTTRAEDFEIAQKLIESVDNREENGHLFAIICKNKARIFPEKLRDKKHIRKWLAEHEKWFKEVKDASGGLSVEVLAKARHLKKPGPPLPHVRSLLPAPVFTSEKRESRGKATPQKAKDETDPVHLLKMADNITLRISGKLKNEGGTVPFESLLKAKDVIYPLCEEEALISFLAAFPLKFEIMDLEGLGKWVHLKGTDNASPNNVGGNNASANDAISKVTSFIFQNGGTVPFANLVKQADTLIDKTVHGPHALSAWLNAKAGIFEVVPKPDDFSKPGQVKVKLSFSPRFCQHYIAHGQCHNKKCQFLHICKAFVCQRPHNKEECKLSHDIRDAHNKIIVDKMGALRKETDKVVVNVLLKSCFPRVCADYNKNGVCPRGDKCHFLHVCGGYVLNQCGNPFCPLSHDVVGDLHNINLLKKYALRPSQKLSVELVKANIAHAQVMKSQSSQSVEVGMARYQDSASIGSSSHDARPLLSFENIQKSNLATSLVGIQKVENWMRCPTQQEAESGFGNLEQRKRSDSTSSSEISHVSNQSSVASSQSSVWQDDLHKKVFITILEKYNGIALFSKISKDKELFGHDGIGDVEKWFASHPQKFIFHRNGQGKIDTVSAFSKMSRICLDYGEKRGCNNSNCGFLHICRNHIESHCPKGEACHLNHDVSSDTVTQAAKRMGLQDLTSEQLVTLIRVSVPTVCHFYNRGRCNRGEFCPNLHICQEFAKGHQFCKAKLCRHGHEEALKQGPATKILKMYRLFGKKPNYRYIQKMIFVFENERRRSSGPRQGGGLPREVQGQREASDEPRNLMDIDLTQKVDSPAQEIEEVTPNICPQFLMQRCRRKKCSQSNVHFTLPYCWQLKLSSSSWCSFDNTDCENIEKYFCDVNCTAAELNISTKVPGDVSSVRLDFQSMSGHPSAGEDFKIRRLECQQKTTQYGSKAWCETPWMWYKLELPKWIKLETSKANVFEELFLEGNFPVDWWSSHRRRPSAFLTESEVNEKKRSEQEQQTPEVKTESTPSSPVSTQPPPPTSEPVRETAPLQSSNCHRTRVEPGSLEYKEIEKLLGSSTNQDALVINQIEKIVSDALWDKYKSRKKSMTDELRIGENMNDRRLFIPCLSEDIERIMRGNIHDSSISRILHKPFGPGYYFTSNASLCIQWCREHLAGSQVSLIVCQVLLGISTQGTRGLKEFPRRHDGKFYDSLVDNKDDPSVFVIENVDQCYPAFVLDILYAATPVNETQAMLQDFEIVEDNHGLTATPRHNYPQIPPPTYVPPNNHPLSPAYVPQIPNTASVALQQQPLPPNTPSGPPDFVKAPPLYSERAPAPVPPPEYTPYPARPPPPSVVPSRGNVRQMSAPRSSGEPKDKKDCLVM